MSFSVYCNLGNAKDYPYLIDVQHALLDTLSTRLVIPLFPADEIKVKQSEKLCPVIFVEGQRYLAMTHEMAGVRRTMLGNVVDNVAFDRDEIKKAIDFLIDGF